MKNRFYGIDGAKGIMSVLVIFCHLACVFLPSLYFIEKADTFARIWLNTPLNILTNGNTAVHFFFISSGFLLANSIMGRDKQFNPIKRYLRILEIVIPAVILAFILKVCGLTFHLQASSVDPDLSFVNTYLNFKPNLKSLLFDLFYTTFTIGSNYVGPLWTIKYEFLGSILIAGICSILKLNRKNTKLFLIFFGLILFVLEQYNYLGFVFGAFVFDCYDRRCNDNTFLGKIIDFILENRILKCLVLIVGIYLACTNISLTGIWGLLSTLHMSGDFARCAGLFLVLLVAFRSTCISRFFSLRPFVFLGKISEYIYAFHWTIILSLGCFIYLKLYNVINQYLLLVVVSIASITITILLSYLYVKSYGCIKDKIKGIFSKKVKNEK